MAARQFGSRSATRTEDGNGEIALVEDESGVSEVAASAQGGLGLKMPTRARVSIGCAGCAGDGDGALDGGLIVAALPGCGAEAANPKDTGE